MAPPPHPAGLAPSSALLPAAAGSCRQGWLSWSPPWSQHLHHSIDEPQLNITGSCSHHCGIPDLIQGSVLLISSEIINNSPPVPAVTLSATHQTLPAAEGLGASLARSCTSSCCSKESQSREDKEPWGWLWMVNGPSQPLALGRGT